MRLGSINFPASLLDSIRDQTLVVFAGAGVSMGPPANLPSFTALANRIGNGTQIKREDDELDDRYLGRLKQHGTDVHTLACRQLDADTLQPTKLHVDLTNLYNAHPRIVTTNFDQLFEKAATSAFAAPVDIYRAPALPLGRSFRGIVHLHGSVLRADEIVLTDADFGRAYLTEGWARTFLIDLFSNWNVLFVGYSHTDTIVNYLSRALPQNSSKMRFALTEANRDPQRWHLLGIEPIIFPQSGERDFSQLLEGVGRLASLVRRSVVVGIKKSMQLAPSLRRLMMNCAT